MASLARHRSAAGDNLGAAHARAASESGGHWRSRLGLFAAARRQWWIGRRRRELQRTTEALFPRATRTRRGVGVERHRASTRFLSRRPRTNRALLRKIARGLPLFRRDA